MRKFTMKMRDAPAEDSGFLMSPPSTNSNYKMASNTTDTASSPGKAKKVPVNLTM